MCRMPIKKKGVQLVLASLSPRRKELIAKLGLPFRTVPSRVAEKKKPGESPSSLVRRLSVAKARYVAKKLKNSYCLVVGADTVVVLKDRIFGKPLSHGDAARMLLKLSGRVHKVFTGIAVAHPQSGKVRSAVAVTKVKFRRLSRKEAARIGKKHMDKSGSYAFQDREDRVVEKVQGDWQTVVGLPLAVLRRLLRPFMVSKVEPKDSGPF